MVSKQMDPYSAGRGNRPRALGQVARYSLAAMVAAGVAAAGCAAELENPNRPFGAAAGASGALPTGGSGGSAAGGAATGGSAAGGTTAAGSGGGGGAPPMVVVPPDPDCWKAVYANQCKLCHTGATLSGLDLNGPNVGAMLSKTAANYSKVTGAKTDCKAGALYIDPVTPANSFLLKKVSNTQGACGTAMPFANMPLMGDDLKC
ncbi:MAG TPA: hypothetical protein VER33_11315, partial [Polyangiaceae bacterium]|nr:hypothetical protein [Polyangiaceae bacterium]